MFGKHFASMYTGSMLGAGPDVFAVWGYCIANAANGQVELNPQHLALLIGMDRAATERAIEYLCAPDSRSRSKTEDGRRLVREGEYAYRLPNWEAYRKVRNEEDRRTYNREAQRRHRSGVKDRVIDGQSPSTLSAQAEAETETEAKDKDLPRTKRAATGHDTWLTPFSASWETRYQGVAPFGPMAKALRPLVDRHGPESVLGAWNRYLAETDAAYASPIRFASTFGRWNGTAPPVGKQTQQERNLANIARGARELEAEEVARGEHESR